MKSLLLILLLASTAYSQSPILELRDDRIPGRKLLVFAGNRYQFFSFPGTIPFEGNAVLEEITECQVRFADKQTGHLISAKANRCDNTGKATLQDFVNAVTYTLADKMKN
jgi:hypothetical protein